MLDLVLTDVLERLIMIIVYDRICVEKKIEEFTIHQITTHPAKNINKNQLPGTANTNIASSASVSPNIRNGIHAKIKIFDIKNIPLAGAWTYMKKKINHSKQKNNLRAFTFTICFENADNP